MTGMPIKYIICDLGGVYFSDGTKCAIEKIKSRFGGDDTTLDELFKSKSRKEGYLLRIGKMTSDGFWKAVRERLKVDKKDVEEIKELWHGSYELNRDMEGLVERLRKKYKVVVFSGNIKERVEYLDKKHDIMGRFDAFVFSFDHGLHKGDAKFVEKMLDVIKANPKECVYIDDKDEYLEFGRRLGMTTILFKDAKNLEVELKNIGVIV